MFDVMVSGEVGRFVEEAERSGGVCQRYMRRLAACERREDFFRVVCDVNGGEWLFSTHEKKVNLPMDGFCKEYRNFLDGKRVMEYPEGYTSKMYCRQDGCGIVADTTLVWLLECKDVKVVVPTNKYPTVVLSNGSGANIVMRSGSRLNLELYGDAEYCLVDGDKSKVRITQH